MSTVNWSGVSDVNWTPVLETNINLGSMYLIVPTEGYLAWEYNPLRNYRLSENMYEKDGKYYTKKEFLNLNPSLKDPIENYESGKGDPPKEFPAGWTLREAGELVDFITNELSFDLSHPVDILPQYSYDGSVNLILNDGLNIPRLINSRFTATGNNTYKVVDRKGDNDTNIYDQGDQFDIDTSLFKNVNKIPKLEYLGTSSGNMKIGNYHFYFKYADADGNESDWVAESGLVSVFIGESTTSVNTGIKDENSNKSVRFKLSNIDIGYSYVRIYYTRYSAEEYGNLIVQAKRIDKNFLVNSLGNCLIVINGDEDDVEITLEEINSSFDSIQNAKTQCSASGRLLMANVHKTRVEYDKLLKLSLCFLPYKYLEDYPLADDGIDEQYNISARSDGYYDSKYIYDKTGYWPGDLYRIGIVYILKDGSLSPVFNVRGATSIPEYQDGNEFYSIDDRALETIWDNIDYSEEDFMITGGVAPNENAKGVIQLADGNKTAFSIIGILMRTSPAVITELKKYTKGFFFVRQKRIPLTLCQGMMVGLDTESRTPTLPTLGGVIANVDTKNTFIETQNINDINYISEGFLGRYLFNLKAKSIGFWKKVGTAFAVVAVLAAATIATVFTCGVGSVAAGTTIAAALKAGVATVGSALSIIGTTSAAVLGTSIVVTAGLAGYLYARLRHNITAVKEIKGRNDKIPKNYSRKENTESRQLTHDVELRYIIKDPTKNLYEAMIVPDYQVNQPYYNLFLSGEEFSIRLTHEQPVTNYISDGYFDSKQRHFYVSVYQNQDSNRLYKVKMVGVPDGCPVKMIGDSVYRARAGYPEEAYKYEFQGKEYEDSVDKRNNSDIIRGNFGSYVGVKDYTGHAGDLVNIMIPGYSDNNLFEYLQIRAQDTSAFYAISDRIDISGINNKRAALQQTLISAKPYQINLFRGDCYVCLYTHRIIRNFNDPSAPYNDKIVDKNTWKNNYNPDKPESYQNINLGDVNAVLLGLWLTFKLRSSYNLNIRTIDKSNVDEYLMCGNHRSFYPHYSQIADGNLKIQDSDLYNKGFTKSVSEKYYFEIPDVPYIKLEFLNRIVFSDIHINDAYKNGFRVIRTTNHKDYPTTYGAITKLIELQNAVMIVFEHGIGFVTIDNNTEHPSLVLSDLTVISDTFGSLWKDSIIKTPGGVYGVDTVAKKIWRVHNGLLLLISESKVQEFLNQNISLSERELTPIIGTRNVKTVYNAFKHDVMFTFYDNLYGLHEKAWNLCYNEMLQIFTTFYSWIPSEMVNIDNMPFSFDRETVKSISKLGVSDHGNDFSDGITLTNNVLMVSKETSKDATIYNYDVLNKTLKLYYTDPQGCKLPYNFNPDLLKSITKDSRFIGFLHLDNRTLPEGKVDYEITYKLLRDNQKNNELFTIENLELNLEDKINTKTRLGVEKVKVSVLKLAEGVNVKDLLSELYYRNSLGHSYADVDSNMIKPTEGLGDGELKYTIHLNKPIFKNKAGKRLLLDEKDQINPDKIVRYLNIKAIVTISGGSARNPQEAYYNQFVDLNGGLIEAGYFESQIAITTNHNLSLLSTDFWKHGLAGIIDIADKIYPTYWYGKQHPFEFECVVVDDPSIHKIFTNLELVSNKVKPESFHYEVVGDVYDFADDKPTMYFRLEALKALYQFNGYNIEYNSNFKDIEPKQHNRSAYFPQYYSRWDTINNIYDSYKRFLAPLGFNYDHLSGAEVVYYPTRNEFRIWNHVEAVDVDSLSLDIATSVIKANCRYLEDKWLVSINPIVVTYKNEFDKNLVENGDFLFTRGIGGVYKYSTWVDGFLGDKLPPINIQGTKLEELETSSSTTIDFPNPEDENDSDNALYRLYDMSHWRLGDWRPIDPHPAKERRETDVRGKFVKVRIRYSGEELAIIDFLNTIYQISFA